ncbi:MAG: GGDEF domain-containing protein [Campylobacterota bacterium]
MCEYDSKLLRFVVDDTPKSIVGLVVVSSLFIWAYIDYIPLEYLLLWSVTQLIFIITRYVNARNLSKYIEEENSSELKFHTVILGVIILFSATIWTSGTILGAIFAPSPYEFVGLAMIMGIIAVSILSLTPVLNVFLAYFFIMTLAQLGVMIYFGTHAHLAIAAFLLIYMPIIVLLSKSIYKNHLITINTHNMLESHVNELKELSITDSLTKAYNRRHFFDAAQTLISIAKRERSEVSFLMIDIDYFKNINDAYGHQVGDYILVRLAQEIKSLIRDSDIFARIGGEEFALLLHGSSLEGAKVTAEKIRSAIEKIDFNDNYITLDVTVSIGCATVDNGTNTLEELYQEADKKLYIAKELGRNRIQ